MPLKPWICWKANAAPKETLKKDADAADPQRNERLKKLLQFKALQTKCHQRQVSLRQIQQTLKCAAERWQCTERKLRAAAPAAEQRPRGPPVAMSPAPETLPAVPPSLPRTAEMWRAEAAKLRAALRERQTLNQCVKWEVETLEKAFYSLIQLGDQQMADLSSIEERNASLREQHRDARADCREQHASYWESQVLHDASPSAASVASCGTLVEEMQLKAAAMHRELGDLEAQLLQSRRQADLAQQQQVVLAQQHLQAAMKSQSAFSPSPRSIHLDRMEADFEVDPEDPEEMAAVGAIRNENGVCDERHSTDILETGLPQVIEQGPGAGADEPSLEMPQLPESPGRQGPALGPGAATCGAPPPDTLRRTAKAVPHERTGHVRLQHHLSENQRLELQILHYKERLQQRLLKEQIAQHRLKAELHRLRAKPMSLGKQMEAKAQEAMSRTTKLEDLMVDHGR